MNRNRRGFSLIEVLIAIGIIALGASLIIPVMKGTRDRASYDVSTLNLFEVAKSMEKHYLEKGIYPVFASWDAVASSESPLREYINDIPTSDSWGRPYRVVKSTETEYAFEGLSITGKLASEYPDYSYVTGPKLKKKGKSQNY